MAVFHLLLQENEAVQRIHAFVDVKGIRKRRLNVPIYSVDKKVTISIAVEQLIIEVWQQEKIVILKQKKR